MKPKQPHKRKVIVGWTATFIAAVAIGLFPVLFLMGVSNNAYGNPMVYLAAKQDGKAALRKEVLEELKLKDITADMQFVCVNGYVYMRPAGLMKSFLTPMMDNGRDQSTGARLVECTRYQKHYNQLLRDEIANNEDN